jgi:hypothetical protein
MRRREFITLVGGVATWPLAARAQQIERMRRIGVLLNLAADDPMAQARVAAFVQGLQTAGWSDGRNVRVGLIRAGPPPILATSLRILLALYSTEPRRKIVQSERALRSF